MEVRIVSVTIRLRLFRLTCGSWVTNADAKEHDDWTLLQ